LWRFPPLPDKWFMLLWLYCQPFLFNFFYFNSQLCIIFNHLLVFFVGSFSKWTEQISIACSPVQESESGPVCYHSLKKFGRIKVAKTWKPLVEILSSVIFIANCHWWISWKVASLFWRPLGKQV
jgi:hypothetical protein